MAAMLESLGSSTEPALDPAGIMARWLCRKVLLVRRPPARECLPSWVICCCKRGICQSSVVLITLSLTLFFVTKPCNNRRNGLGTFLLDGP